MIVVDTNVVSEPLRRSREPRVTEWFDSQALETLYLSAITVAELRFVVRSMPNGRRRDQLYENLEEQIFPRFAGRVLPFDLPASQAYAELMSEAQSSGSTIPVADGLIAATALANRMMVATRDTFPFEAAGLRTLNPWNP